MYSSERTEWWRKRTLDKAHQEAYNNIARFIPSKGKRFLDVGCGTGEILKRAWSETKYQLYVGTDATPEMIDISRENLHDLEINARIASRVGHALVGSRKVLLLHDDITNSKVPLNFADTTMIVFPEILLELGDSTKEFSSRELAFMKELTYNKITKRTKKGGKVITVAYDVGYKNPEEEESHLIDIVKVNFLFRGLELESHEFFESREIWNDAQGTTLKKGEIPGYRIFVSTRIR